MIILIALLLILIAGLCLRFTMLTTIEEDYREIGVMKAIGISNQDIRKLYIIKYIAASALACVLGYVLSLLIGSAFTANISLYMGTAKPSVWTLLLPIFGVGLVFGAIVLFCRIVLRRFRKISALEALRSGTVSGTKRGSKRTALSHSPIRDVNIFLGVKEVFSRFFVYGLLCFVFILCSFLMIVPLNFLNTLESPSFVSYMGAGQCDLRIDLQQTEDINTRYIETEQYIQKEARQTAIMKSLGFTVKNISKQYMTRAILVLTAGMLGEKLAGLLISGISDMQFVVNPLLSYFICPMALVVSVTATIIFSSRTIRDINVLMDAE